MAALDTDLSERRGEGRRAGGGARWQTEAILRPGQPVILVNICSRAALLESAARLRPGARTEMQLAGDTTKTRVQGHLERCCVTALEPIRYRGVMIFEQPVEVGAVTSGPHE